MTRSILRFKNNEPLTVKLDRLDGKETQSKISGATQYLYVCDDDTHVIYLDPPVRAQLLKTGAQAGDMVEFTKFANGTWGVKVLSDASDPEPAPAPKRVVQSAVPIRSNGTNGATALAPQPAPVSYPSSHPFEERYARMFVTAAHALQIAHNQLIAEGMDLEPFTWEEIEKVAVHFAISFEKKEAQR